MYDSGCFPFIKSDVFESEDLNAFIGLGKQDTTRVRLVIQRELTTKGSMLETDFSKYTYLVRDVSMHLPVNVGDIFLQ